MKSNSSNKRSSRRGEEEDSDNIAGLKPPPRPGGAVRRQSSDGIRPLRSPSDISSARDGPTIIPETVPFSLLQADKNPDDQNEKSEIAFGKHETSKLALQPVGAVTRLEQKGGVDVQVLKDESVGRAEKIKNTGESKESGSLAYAAIQDSAKKGIDKTQDRPQHFDTIEADPELLSPFDRTQERPGAYSMPGTNTITDVSIDPSQNTSTLDLIQGIPPEPYRREQSEHLLSAVLVEDHVEETRQSQELPYAQASTVPPEKPWWRTVPFFVGLSFLVIGVIVAVVAVVATRSSNKNDTSSIITVVATEQPSVSLFPSVHPTAIPTIKASVAPSVAASFSPTLHPSSEPSVTPTLQPTSSPSSSPSTTPTLTPTSQPSSRPSATPTGQPTAQPSSTPSVAPTRSRLGVMQELIRSFSPTGALPPVDSPQDRALNWAVYNDGADVPLTNTDRLTTRYALATFFFSTRGSISGSTAWFDQANFLSSDHECDWHSPSGTLGVDCNTDQRVIALNLVDNRIFGSIPEEIGLLKDLRSLDLNGRWRDGGLIYVQSNNLQGTLPTQLGQLEKLVVLNLSGNDGLGGTLPTEIAQLTSLVELRLNDDSFSGNVPPQIGTMPSLTFLELSYNGITGSIPSSLDNIQCMSFGGNEVTCDWFRRRIQKQQRHREMQAFSNGDTCTRYIPPCELS